MPPWQKRLNDLSHLLRQCHSTYMEPELFRRNINQFLQTARTVTFIIQKNKDTIPNFDGWYGKSVIEAWKEDAVMQWAKDARNKIEKEGDLNLHSSVSLKLFIGYLQEHDLDLKLDSSLLLHASVKRLKRIAQKRLPSGISRDAGIKVDRQWIADSLPTQELLGAICTVYRRIYDACRSLASHLAIPLDPAIPEPDSFDDLAQESRQVRYYKLDSTGSFTFKTKRTVVRRDALPPEVQAEIKAVSLAAKHDRTMAGTFRWLGAMAENAFQRDGYHVPMAFLFDQTWAPLDIVSFAPDDVTDKFIIWRNLGERVRSIGAHGLAFIGEAWMREGPYDGKTAIRNLPVVGEILQLDVVARDGEYRHRAWGILREGGVPSLRAYPDELPTREIPNFLAPVMAAFGIPKPAP